MGRRKQPGEPAHPERTVRRPRSWDKAVAVALLRLLGASQDASARHAGCALRSVVKWEQSDWWPKAQEEARERWFQGGTQRSMLALYKLLEQGDAQTVRWWAERCIKELAPPIHKTQLTGKDEGPIEVRDARDENARTIARLASALETEVDPEQSE